MVNARTELLAALKTYGYKLEDIVGAGFAKLDDEGMVGLLNEGEWANDMLDCLNFEYENDAKDQVVYGGLELNDGHYLMRAKNQTDEENQEWWMLVDPNEAEAFKDQMEVEDAEAIEAAVEFDKEHDEIDIEQRR